MCAIDNLLAEADEVIKFFPEITNAEELCTAVSEALSYRHNCHEACAATYAFQKQLEAKCKLHIAKKAGCEGDCNVCATAQMGCYSVASQTAPTHAFLN